MWVEVGRDAVNGLQCTAATDRLGVGGARGGCDGGGCEWRTKTVAN